MARIGDVLNEKGGEVASVSPDTTIHVAIEELVGRKIGCLLIRDGDGPVIGILTERDILRIVHQDPGGFAEATVGDHMTKDVVCAVPDDDLDYAMNVMTKNRFRRMPVQDGDDLVGIISIGDVVKALKSEKEYEVRMLRRYIGAM